MARAKTITELLAEQPPDDLAKMREANQRQLTRAREEVAKLELQGHLIDAALAKRGKPGRPGALNPEVVLDAAHATEPPMTAAEVRDTLASRGHDVSVNAVRNHLNRLVASGDLSKDDDKKFFVPFPPVVPREFVPAAGPDFRQGADDDVPF